MNRILVLYTQSLLGAGAASTLLRDPRFDVLGSTYINRSILFREVERFKPNTVVLDEHLHNSEPRLVYDLLNCAYPPARVIVIEAEENQVQIYEHKAFQINHLKDMISAVEGKVEQFSGD